jgi:hypothetical protein
MLVAELRAGPGQADVDSTTTRRRSREKAPPLPVNAREMPLEALAPGHNIGDPLLL